MIKEQIVTDIEHTLDKIRPFINRDGGDVEFVSFDETTGIVYVKMLGACEGCAFIDGTLTLGIEAILVEEVKGVSAVKLVSSEDIPSNS